MRYIWFVILFLCPLLVQGQGKKIGDVIENPDGSKGVVFWLNPDGTGGWMVALKDMPASAAWGASRVNIPDLPDITGGVGISTLGNALADTAGYRNTKIMRDFQGNRGAFAAQVVDFDNGWYLPAMGQLRRLFAIAPTITPVLEGNGGEGFKNSGAGLESYTYFSSTEGTADAAWCCLFAEGQIGTTEKSKHLWVRAVRSFSYIKMEYDRTLTYQWKGGEKTPMITDVPAGSKEYVVTVETSAGCKNKATKQVFVAKGNDTTIYDVICKGETYQKHGFQVSAAGVYTKELKGANNCSFKLTLVLSVNEPKRTEFHETICDGDIYKRHNFTEWKAGTYTQSWVSEKGCDSLVVLHLTVNPTKEKFIYDTICDGDTYADHGFLVSKAGSYSRKLQSVTGCDSIVNLSLTVKPLYNDTIRATIRSGATYTGYGFNEKTAGVYLHTSQSVFGCDSLMTLVLTVEPESRDTIRAAICEGEVYDADGFHESVAGTYVQILQNSAGNDSLVALVLTVNPVYAYTLRASICHGEVYEANGFRESVPGTYTRNLKSVSGCDSVVTLVLTENPIYSDTIRAVLCEGEVYAANGFRESVAGTYTRRHLSVSGCDSLVTLVLKVNPVYHRILPVSLCEGEVYEANGFHESTAGTYTRNLQSVSGCDSIVTLVLTVNRVYNRTIPATICQGESYVGNGFDESTAGTYTRRYSSVFGCDSIVTLVLTVGSVYDGKDTIRASVCQGEVYASNGFKESVAGVYSHTLQSKFGCDSTVVLDLTVNPVYLFESAKELCEGDGHDFFGTLLTTSGVYERKLLTKEGCDSIYRLTLQVHALADTLIEAVICQGATYRENGFDVSEPGEYVRHLQSTKRCDSTVRLQLKIEVPFDGAISVSRKDCETHAYLFEAVAGETAFPVFPPLTWDFGDGFTGTDRKMEHRYEEPGEYRVSLKTGEACQNTADYLLHVLNLMPGIDLYADRTELDLQHPTVRLWTEQMPGTAYEWDLGDGTSLSGHEVTHTYGRGKEYYEVKLTATNSDGCLAADSLRITYFWDIVPPNTFSPNGDGINDFFMKGYRVQITDRNGIEIFRGNDGWDGTYKGKQVPEDTYFYKLYVPEKQGERMKTGYITVVR